MSAPQKVRPLKTGDWPRQQPLTPYPRPSSGRLGGLPQSSGEELQAYLQSLIHEWAKTLTTVGYTLIPLFFVLDYFMMPRELLARFALYRLVATGIIIGQFFVLKHTQAGKTSYLHGYFFSLVLAEMISLMTTSLGGLSSTYYAGLNLVMMMVNLMLPWRAFHSALNSAIIISLYLVTNLALPSSGPPVEPSAVLNNLFFLVATGVVTVAINFMKERLIRQEFLSRRDLQRARDALWSEMAVAKRLQTSLLPRAQQFQGFKVAATMLPAEEIGGDYYDVIQTGGGEVWVTIGDVSGHGVESGLIMMMTQTSIFTAVNKSRGLSPAAVLRQVNSVLTENISRLGTDRYVTVSALVLRDGQLTYAGKHQDILIFRADTGKVEMVPTEGAWLGVVGEISGHVHDRTVPLGPRDVVLLFTDGVTEATDAYGRMFGEEALERALQRYAGLELEDLVNRIVREVKDNMATQTDDLTLLAFRRAGQAFVAAHTGT